MFISPRRRLALGAILVGAILGAPSSTGWAAAASDAARPNILWITTEDNSAYWIGAYGNSQASTPRIDGLAREGALYLNAYANAPVCAVARSTLLTGVYAVTQGTQHMRSRYPIPDQFVPYVTYLREAGYYCTNNSKTDYNIRGRDQSYWDESSKKAHYRNRPEGAPFFAIFNLTTSHESSLFAAKTANYRKSGLIPEQTRLSSEEVTLPPLYPDLPEVRKDLATYYDVVSAMDRQVGALLDELQQQGLADDTIVFYYSDHGGILPRSKRYLNESGTHVPLAIRVPEKFKHLTPHAPGARVEELVSFVDFAPTLLSLVGLSIPEHMQGHAFLGPARKAERTPIFLFADRFDETYRHQRGLFDGTFRYIHNFAPHLPGSAQNNYPYGIASWRAWKAAAETGDVEGRYADFFATPQPTAELYRTAEDPWEIDNLAAAPQWAGKARELRTQLRSLMIARRDLGLFPEPFWFELARDQPVYDYVRESEFPWELVADRAFMASDRRLENLPALIEGLSDEHPVVRFWSANGCLALGPEAAPAESALTRLLKDPHAANRITALHALVLIRGPEEELLGSLKEEALVKKNDPAAALAMHTLYQLQALKIIDDEEAKQAKRQSPGEYATRWANRVLSQEENP